MTNMQHKDLRLMLKVEPNLDKHVAQRSQTHAKSRAEPKTINIWNKVTDPLEIEINYVRI